MSILADIAQFQQTRAAGKIAQGEAKVAAKQEELAATSREVDRKERLAQAISSQNASAGSRGVAAFEGSPLSVISEDIRREETAAQRDKFQTQLSASTLRARGKIARIQASTGANIGLLRAAGEKAEGFAKGKPK